MRKSEGPSGATTFLREAPPPPVAAVAAPRAEQKRKREGASKSIKVPTTPYLKVPPVPSSYVGVFGVVLMTKFEYYSSLDSVEGRLGSVR